MTHFRDSLAVKFIQRPPIGFGLIVLPLRIFTRTPFTGEIFILVNLLAIRHNLQEVRILCLPVFIYSGHNLLAQKSLCRGTSGCNIKDRNRLPGGFGAADGEGYAHGTPILGISGRDLVPRTGHEIPETNIAIGGRCRLFICLRTPAKLPEHIGLSGAQPHLCLPCNVLGQRNRSCGRRSQSGVSGFCNHFRSLSRRVDFIGESGHQQRAKRLLHIDQLRACCLRNFG